MSRTAWWILVGAVLVAGLLAIGFISRHNEVIRNEARAEANG